MIVLFMRGGMSHIDTFDPKPGRPTGGTFRAIETTLPDVRFSEHLPRLAERAGKMTLIRSLVGSESNHVRAEHLLRTGYQPQSAVEFPAWGSYVDRHLGDGVTPGYIAIGRGGTFGAGFLGPDHMPLSINEPTKAMRPLRSPRGVDQARRSSRTELLTLLDEEFYASHPSSVARDLMAARDRATALTGSSKSNAFDLDRETQATRARYGQDSFGQGCLLARRLVDADIPFAEVRLHGWDTHADNFPAVASLSAKLDRSCSALLDDLEASGRLSSTLVVLVTEFGRTPKINDRGGRDHHARCFSVLLAGGGMRPGRVIGTTDEDGAEVSSRPVTVPDLFASLAFALGIQADEELMSGGGRPIRLVDPKGAVVRELFA